MGSRRCLRSSQDRSCLQRHGRFASESRLKLISSSLGARVVLSGSTQVELARQLADEVIVVDASSSASLCNSSNMTSRTSSEKAQSSDDVMYVCFTSGSTGVPKGVMVTHKNLASAAVPQVAKLGFGIGSRVYDFSSHAFDAHIWHTWWALISGACLCIPSQDDRLGNLAGSIDSFKSTIGFLTPSVARTIDPNDIPTMKKLFLGGEGVAPSDVSQWGQRLELWGGYGPTEATPVSLFKRLQNPEDATNIGKAIGLTPWICNPENIEELTATGAVGELVLEGPLVSLGYHRDPKRTAAAFFENPGFLAHKGRSGRLYRTGDLVRYAFDGSCEYIGRADTQVKLRGQRVEFGEIEYHLTSALPDARSVVCDVAAHPQTGRQTLVAFCALSTLVDTAASGMLPETTAVAARTHLGKRLPPYMVPEAFFVLEDMPMNRSGKVDRHRLKVLGPQLLQRQQQNTTDRSDSDHVNDQPLTEMESLLRILWVTCLGRPAEHGLGPDSDFFEAGGDSITAMKLSNLARRRDLSLPVQTIMKSPKLSTMAQCLSPPDTSSQSSGSPAPFSLISPSLLQVARAKAAEICGIAPSAIDDMYPCTPLQTELFALTLRQPRAYVRHAVYAVHRGVELDRLVRAWDVVVTRNAVLRTRFCGYRHGGRAGAGRRGGRRLGRCPG